MNEIIDKQEILQPIPQMVELNIDDDCFFSNGEAFFHLSDVKTLIKTQHQQNMAVPVIVCNFVGFNLMLPFPTADLRDETFEEMKSHLRALKNNTIHIYLKRKKEEREKKLKAIA